MTQGELAFKYEVARQGDCRRVWEELGLTLTLHANQEWGEVLSDMSRHAEVSRAGRMWNKFCRWWIWVNFSLTHNRGFPILFTSAGIANAETLI